MVEHGFFLMKYLVVRCETFCGVKKKDIFDKTFMKIIVFESYFIKLLLKDIVLPYEWNLFDKKNQCLSQKMNV